MVEWLILPTRPFNNLTTRPITDEMKNCYRPLKLCGILLLLLFFLISCSVPKKRLPSTTGHTRPYKIGKKWYQPAKRVHRGYKEQGIASWYGEDFHGKKTSSGEIYDMHALTAAHKILPLGTYVRVTNLHNKQTVVVKINDRGPFVKGRIVDLSYRGAQAINIVESGTAPVELKALGRLQETVVDGKIKQIYTPDNYYVGEFTIQVGAFKEKTNAAALLKRLAANYNNTHIAVYKTGAATFYRVRVARFTTLEKAKEIEQSLRQNGYHEAIVVSP